MQHKLDINGLLSRLPLFRNLDAEQIAALARTCHQVRVSKHEYVFHKGDQANGMHIVAVGHIKLALPSPSGHEKVIEFFGPGQAFGEAVMFLERPYMVSAQALEDTLLIWIDKSDIYAAIDRDPSFARRMLAGLSLRLHMLVQDIETVSLQNAAQRVIAYLLNQPREGDRTSFAFNKVHIASKLGLTPETLSRLLQQLMQAGLISVDKLDVTIHDVQALEQRLYSGG